MNNEQEKNEEIELEKQYSATHAAAALRRLADALETKRSFYIQIHGKKVRVPPHATVEIEYESADGMEELEFELKWRSDPA